MLGLRCCRFDLCTKAKFTRPYRAVGCWTGKERKRGLEFSASSRPAPNIQRGQILAAAFPRAAILVLDFETEATLENSERTESQASSEKVGERERQGDALVCCEGISDLEDARSWTRKAP